MLYSWGLFQFYTDCKCRIVKNLVDIVENSIVSMLKTLLKMLKTLIIQAYFISHNLLKSIIHTICIYVVPLKTQQKKPLLKDFFTLKYSSNFFIV